MIAKDRPKLTKQAIESLYQHTPVPFTLCVVDDVSKQETLDVLVTVGECLRYHERSLYDYVWLTNQEIRGVGGSKNRAVASCSCFQEQAPLLYISDNDVYFTAGWLDKLLEAWPLAYAAGFRILGGYNHPYHLIAGIEVGTPAPVVPTPHGQVEEYYGVGGASWLLAWETWGQYGPFLDNARGICQSEDYHLCQRIRTAGFKVGALVPHTVLHTGLTSTGNTPAVGKEFMKTVEGVYFE